MLMEQIQGPQFILWDKKNGWAGTFRLAKLKEFPHYPNEIPEVNYDFFEHYELGESISPRSLILIASSYMEPVKISDKIRERDNKGDSYFKRGIVQEIVENAEEIAKKQGFPYFSVVNFLSSSEKIKIRENKTLEEQLREMKVMKPGKKEERKSLIFHPTVQLYMPKQ